MTTLQLAALAAAVFTLAWLQQGSALPLSRNMAKRQWPSAVPRPFRREAATADEALSPRSRRGASPAAPAGYKLTEEVQRPIRKPTGVTPCVVTILRDQNFSSYPGEVPVNYSLPTGRNCFPPWQLVVASFSAYVTGRQYDRVANFTLDGLLLFLTTTAEPVRLPGVVFGLERDVTRFSTFLSRPRSGFVTLANIVNDVYTGIFYVTVQLLFYPGRPPADLPLAVVPVPSSSFRVPRNVVSAKVELYASHYGPDEFYYANVAQSYYDSLTPDQQAGQANGSSFREVVVYLNGAPVGAIFPQPLVYSGGIDPVFWAPFMGVGSVYMPVYSLDITPFVGTLVNGSLHNLTVGVTFSPRKDIWRIGGALLLWLDPNRTQTAGRAFVQNFPRLTYAEAISAKATLNTNITVTARRQYVFSGFVVSSAGNITTRVTSSLSFSNTLVYSWGANTQTVDFYSSTVSGVKTLDNRGALLKEINETSEYPLHFVFDAVGFPDMSYTLYSRVSFGAFLGSSSKGLSESLQNLQEVSSYRSSRNRSQTTAYGTQSYISASSKNGCYARSVASNYIPGSGFNITYDLTNTVAC